MNQVVTDVWPILLTALLSALGMYVGFINKMRSEISVLNEKVKHLEGECKEVSAKMTEQAHTNTVLEEKVKRMELRQDNHSKKNDEIINLITEFKLEMAEKIGDVSIQMGKIQSDVEVINKTIAVFDAGVVSRKKKGK